MSRDTAPPSRPGRRSYWSRFLRLAGGTLLTALGVVLILQADIGLDSWSVFHQGLEKTVGVSFGAASILTGALALLLALWMGEAFGIGTLCNIVLCGVAIDFLCAGGWIPLSHSLQLSLLYVLAGMECLAFGTWLYMSSRLGAGPRDALTVALARKTGRSVGACRTAMDVLVTFAGWLMGGQFGLGTLLTALLFGSLLGLNFKLMRFAPAAIVQENCLDTLRAFGWAAEK